MKAWDRVVISQSPAKGGKCPVYEHRLMDGLGDSRGDSGHSLLIASVLVKYKASASFERGNGRGGLTGLRKEITV